MLNEQELVEESQAGSLEAFEQLIALTENRVYAIAYKYMNNQEDAKDIAQESYLKAFRAIKGFRQEASFLSWISQIARNSCLDELRKMKNKETSSLDENIFLEEGSVQRQIKDERPNPEEVLENKELKELLRDLIGQLKSDYRIVLILRDLEGYSYEDIAKLEAIPIGTVKSRISRARKALKDELLKYKKEGK